MSPRHARLWRRGPFARAALVARACLAVAAGVSIGGTANASAAERLNFPHYFPTTTPVSALRHGSLKLLEYYEDARTELYDLASDPGEQTNLVAHMPEKAAELRNKLRDWLRTAGARLPVSNPQFGAKPDPR